MNPDQFRIFWFADETLNTTSSPWGQTSGIQLHLDTAPRYYNVYKVDLAAPPNGSLGAPWTSHSTWQGLRIDPTINAGVTFAVDWVRLTTCGANNQTITWTTKTATAVWLNAAGANRWVRVATVAAGSTSTALDVQGIPPGSYTVGLGSATSCCTETSRSPLVIDAAPIADFVSPSFFSGPEYSSQSGAPWDFNSASDVRAAYNMNYTIHDSVLDTSIPGPYPDGVDAQFFLNTPQSIQPAAYRYLSFRMYTDWKAPWQNVPEGMIARFIWSILGTSGHPTDRCWLTSQDIPFDIGWQTYWIDLGDPFNGKPELSAPTACPSTIPAWTNSPPILDLRFDPDENITQGHDAITGGGPFHHEIDWMRLNAIDSVKQGVPYSIQMHLNRSYSQIIYYYTTNLSVPTQAAARQYSTGQVVSGSYRVFLPIVAKPAANTDMAGLPAVNTTFMWDTRGVARNTYYICARVTGGGTTATYCSEAPIVVN